MKQCISNLLIRLRFASRENRPTPKNIVRKKKKKKDAIVSTTTTSRHSYCIDKQKQYSKGKEIKRYRKPKRERERGEGGRRKQLLLNFEKTTTKKNDKTQSKSIQFMIMPKKHQTQPARQSERSASTCQHTRA